MIASIVLTLAASTALAQAPKTFTDCSAHEEMPLQRGDLLKVNCDLAVVLSPVAYGHLVDQREQLKKLPVVWDETRQAYVALQDQQKALINELKGMNQLQNSYYDALRDKYGQVDKIAVESVENTRAALRLARGARLSSYVTAGLLGGVGGGLTGSQVGSGGKIGIVLGAGAGALVGIGINWGLLKLMGAQ